MAVALPQPSPSYDPNEQASLRRQVEQLIGALQSANNAAALVQANLRVFNVRDFGAKGNGVADDRVAIQAALTAAGSVNVGSIAAGAVVTMPPGQYLIGATLTLPSNVCVVGTGGFVDRFDSNAGPQATITSNFAGTLVNVGTANNWQLRNIGFVGSALSGGRGVVGTNCYAWLIDQCSFTNFGDQAVSITGSAGLDGRFSRCFVINSVLVRTGRSAYIGAVELLGQDTVIENCNLNCSISTASGQYGSGFITALLYGSGARMINNVCAFAQVGAVAASGTQWQRAVGCRFEFNQGPGLLVLASGGIYDSCSATDNGLAATNTYDGFVCAGTANANLFLGCRADSTFAATILMRYGFSDSTSGVGVTNGWGNQFVHCRLGPSAPPASGTYNNSGANGGTWEGYDARRPAWAQVPGGGGSAAGTITNAPVAGNPATWLLVNINGTQYQIPAWLG